MGKHKHVFKEAVSEMKHFLVGAGLVLTLVAVVPALAQFAPSPGGDMPPPPSGGTGFMPPPSGGNMPPPGGDMGGGGMPPPMGGQQQMGGQQPMGQAGMGMQQGQSGMQGQGQQGFGQAGMGMQQGQSGMQGQGQQGFGQAGMGMQQGQSGMGQSKQGQQGMGMQQGQQGMGQQGQGQFPGQGKGVESGFPGQNSRGAVQDTSAIPSGFNIEDLIKQFSKSKNGFSDEEAERFKEEAASKDTTISDLKKMLEEKEGQTKKEREEMLKAFEKMTQESQKSSKKSSKEESFRGEEDFGSTQRNQEPRQQSTSDWGNWAQQKGKTNTWDMRKFQKSADSNFGSYLPKTGTFKLEIPTVDFSDEEGEQLDALKSALNALAKVRSARKLKQQAAAFAVQIENFCNATEMDCESEFADLEDLFMNPSVSKKKTLSVLKDVLGRINDKFEEGDFMLEEEVQ